MSKPVLLDNTVLTNFALINRPDLVIDLWSEACITSFVQAEYQAGITARQLPLKIWDTLPIVALTDEEMDFSHRLSQRLGIGERTSLAVAYYRNGLFVSDDFDARRQAQKRNIPTTGSVGILLLHARQKNITLDVGNTLLSQLIQFGYRSPVNRLDELLMGE